MDAIKNFAKATVFDGNYDSSDTEIDMVALPEGRLPVAPFNAVWWNATDYPDPSDDPGVEIIRITDVDGDTLTIERGQEDTAAADHNAAGKTYLLIAGMTARTITEMVGNVFTGTNPYFAVDVPNDSIEIASRLVRMGDVQGAGNSTSIAIDDDQSRISLTGQLATDQSESATVAVGVLAGKLPIRDATGSLIGYIPIYATIT